MLELLHERDVIQQEAQAELRSRFLRVRHRAGRRADRQARHGRIERQDRNAARAAPPAAALARADRDLSAADGRGRKAARLETGPGQGREADRADQLAGGDRDRREPRRGRAVASAQTGRADRRHRRGGEEAHSSSWPKPKAGRDCCSAKGRPSASRWKARPRRTCCARKIASYGDPRVYALALATQYLSQSQQPLVPERLFVTGNGGGAENPATQGILGTLISLLVAERTGFRIDPRVEKTPECPSAESRPGAENR